MADGSVLNKVRSNVASRNQDKINAENISVLLDALSRANQQNAERYQYEQMLRNEQMYGPDAMQAPEVRYKQPSFERMDEASRSAADYAWDAQGLAGQLR